MSNPTFDMSVWGGRVDAWEGTRARYWHEVIQPISKAQAPGVALIGFACDEGVRRNLGRIGARRGPHELRKILANLAVHSERPLYETGDEDCAHGNLERAQIAFGARIAALLDAGHLPIGLGGGHEIAFGTFTGLVGHLAKKSANPPRIGIVTLDAHFDLRKATQANSGNSFLLMAESCSKQGWPFGYCCLGIAEPSNTAALFDRARELGVMWRTDSQLCDLKLAESVTMLQNFLAGVDQAYLSICLDVLPAAVAPGVSAPAARGVGLETIELLAESVKASGKLLVADIAELNPDFDQDNRTAKIAARLVYQLSR